MIQQKEANTIFKQIDDVRKQMKSYILPGGFIARTRGML